VAAAAPAGRWRPADRRHTDATAATTNRPSRSPRPHAATTDHRCGGGGRRRRGQRRSRRGDTPARGPRRRSPATPGI